MENNPEQALLGALMILPEKIDEVATVVDPTDFVDPKHRAWYQAMLKCYGDTLHFDDVALQGQFTPEQLAQVGGAGYIRTLAAQCGFPYSYKTYAHAVRENANRLRLHGIYDEGKRELAKLTPDEVVERTAQRLDDLRNRSSAQALRSFKDLSQSNVERFKKARAMPRKMLGLSCGIQSIDNITRGFRDGKTYIIVANTSMGKSTAAASFVANMPYNGLVVTTEVPPDDWLDKVIASIALVNSDKIATGDVSDQEAIRVIDAYAEIERRNCHIVDLGTPTAEEVGAYFRMGIRLWQYKYLLVDSISNMSAEGLDAIFDVTKHVSNSFQALARATSKPIIMTCQAKPEVTSRVNKIPRVGDTVGGGSTGRDADVMLSLYRHDYYVEEGTEKPNPAFPSDTALFMVAKNRAGQARNKAAIVSYRPGIGIFNRGEDRDND